MKLNLINNKIVHGDIISPEIEVLKPLGITEEAISQMVRDNNIGEATLKIFSCIDIDGYDIRTVCTRVFELKAVIEAEQKAHSIRTGKLTRYLLSKRI